jgi:hypothetical protein
VSRSTRQRLAELKVALNAESGPDQSARSGSSDEKGPSARLHSLQVALSDLRSIAITSGLALTLVVLVMAIGIETLTRTVVITGLSVPRGLQDAGYTPEVVSKLLLDQVNSIRRKNQSLRNHREISSSLAVPDITVSGVGLSTGQITLVVRRMIYGRNDEVSGEIAINEGGLQQAEKKSYELHLRNLDRHLEAIRPDITGLMTAGAENVLQLVDPYSFAVYLEDRDPDQALSLIQQMMGSWPENEKKWLYNMWGNILDS